MLCVVLCVVVVVVMLVVVVCVFVYVCVSVCCGTLKKRGKNQCVDSKTPPCVHSQSVPVYAGTTRTCVSTCARGASTHGDVLNVHKGTF